MNHLKMATLIKYYSSCQVLVFGLVPNVIIVFFFFQKINLNLNKRW